MNMWCVQISFEGGKIKKKRRSNKLMLLRSQTLPFLLFQTSVSILSMSIQPLAPYVHSGSVVF